MGCGPCPRLRLRVACPVPRSPDIATDTPTPESPAAARRASGRRSFLPLGISLCVHALGLGFGAWLYVAESPPPERPRLALQLTEIVEPRQPQDRPPPHSARDDPPALPRETPWPDDPVLPPDPPTEDMQLPAEVRPAPRPPPLQLLPEVPIRAVKVRVRVESPPPPPVQPAPARPRTEPRKRPGRPLRVTYRPDLQLYYPREMQLRGIEGTSLVGISVDRAGRVTDAWLVRSSGWPLLDRAALRVMRDHRFAPGDGGRAQVPVDFRLR